MNPLDPNNWIEFGKNFGVGSIFAFFMLGFAIWCIRYVLRACFSNDEKKPGFLRTFFYDIKDAAVTFLKNMDARLDRQEAAATGTAAVIAASSESVKTMMHAHLDPDGTCNPGRLENAAKHGLDAIDEIGKRIGADVSQHIQAAKNKLG
jgi:hypothetical protein